MKKPKVSMGSMDFIMVAVLLCIIAIGVLMVYSSSSYVASFDPAYHNDSLYFAKRQMLFAFVGLICMFSLANIDYHNLKKVTWIIMLATIVLLVAVFAFPPINGARRWIDLKITTIQPSEIAKYTVVLYMAKSIELKGEKIKNFLYGIFPYLLVSGLYAGLVLAEKNLSICSVIMIVTLIILYTSGAKLSHMFSLLGTVGAVGVIFTISESYRLDRLMNFMNPWKDSKGKGYQLVQSLLALGSGGVWGMGFGQSRQKCYYIPEPYNDFIFAIIGEELGLIGCSIIIILFLLLIWRGIRTAINSKDIYGTLLATGITSIIGIQAIINIAVVTGSMPVTGVPLPFISAGGSSLVLNMAAMGILLNITRQTQKNNV